VQRTSRPVLDVCHALSDLVEAGAVGIVEPPAARSSSGNGAAAATTSVPTPSSASRKKSSSDRLVEPEEPYGPGVEEPHLGPQAHAEDENPAEKGEFLRVFSALRDK
jgi:hypothetical protein